SAPCTAALGISPLPSWFTRYSTRRTSFSLCELPAVYRFLLGAGLMRAHIVAPVCEGDFPMSEQANLASAHMEDCMKHATPGEGHKALEPFVGSWNARVTMWMDPSQPPIEADGVMENRWIH